MTKNITIRGLKVTRSHSTMKRVTVSLVLAVVVSAKAIQVSTTSGELEGSSYVNSVGKEIFTFLGVPYARPPVGKHRFDEPRPVKNWTGVWQALQYTPHCIQYEIHGKEIVGEEDCLYLNVYTPSVLKTANLPVLVYYHGGAFTFGGPSYYKPTFLLDGHDIVFVSVAYRLGPFGFLSTEDEVAPGNSGLKDQALALRWVQENVENFGGDKNQVTISGNSAGGASVHYHYFSPQSQGLFANGISSSGSALMSWSFTEGSLQKAKALADAVGCPTNASDVMMKCLKHRPSRQILSKVQPLFMPWGVNPFTPFGPVVEKSVRNPFLNEHPLELLLRGEVADAPLLASVTTEEGLYPVATFIDHDNQLQILNDNWTKLAPHLLDYNYTIGPDNINQVSEKVREYYFKGQEISDLTRGKLTEMVGDRLFNVGMDLALRIQASVVTSEIFFFRFGYRGKLSLSNLFSKTKANFGVSHFDDMYYSLTLPESLDLTENEEKAMIKLMTSIWVSFMKTGKPQVSNIEWEPVPNNSYETGNLPYVFIKSPSEILLESSDDFGNRKFWDSLGLNENNVEQSYFKDEL